MLHAAAAAAQSLSTLCNPMDCSLPGSSIHGILQALMLEWVAMPTHLQGIFLTQGSELGLPHCRGFFTAEHQGSPGASWADRKSKISSLVMSSSLILCKNSKPFLKQMVTCDGKQILYDNRHLSGQTIKKLQSTSQSQTCVKKKFTVTVWWSAARSDLLQLSESQWNHYI